MKETKKGVQLLQSGQAWNYENLILSFNKDGLLLVQNGLFWHDNATPSADELKDCLKQMTDDVRRLQKNAVFKEQTQIRDIKIQVFDNSGSKTPLMETVINE